jgi:pimeloyl-ACP methyl ester carboxylesterase
LRLLDLLRRLTHLDPSLQIEPSGYDPRALHVRFYSRTLGVEKALHLFVPEEGQHHGARLPILYLLRGHEREWINPHEDTARGGRNAVDVYLGLRASGAIGPLLLAMPGLTSEDGRLPGMLTNYRAPELAKQAAGIGSGRFEDYFVQELLPLVARHFAGDGARQSVAGFSLGGAMAAKVAAQHPQLFRSVGAYDGTFLYAEGEGEAVRGDDGVLANPLFDPVFGVPRDLSYVASQSPANLILRGNAAALGRLRWLIQYGPEAIEPWGSNFYRGEHLLEALRRRGIANALERAALDDGDHSWRTADRHLELTLPLHYGALIAP